VGVEYKSRGSVPPFWWEVIPLGGVFAIAHAAVGEDPICAGGVVGILFFHGEWVAVGLVWGPLRETKFSMFLSETANLGGATYGPPQGKT